jgi:hypothetical protein
VVCVRSERNVTEISSSRMTASRLFRAIGITISIEWKGTNWGSPRRTWS